MDSATVQSIIEESTEAIKETAKRKIVETVSDQIGWSAREVVAAEARKFVEEEIAPEVAKYLAGERGAIVKAVQEASDEIGAALKARLVESAVETLSGYRAKNVISELLAK